MKKKVFISGPMSGYDNFNREAFMEAEKKLKDAGYSVFNPAWLNFDETWDTASIMAIDMAALSRCDAIYQLDGWRKSKGAKAEYRTAEWLGLDILGNNLSVKKKYLEGEDGVIYKRGDEKKKQDFLNGVSSRKDLASI